MRRTKAEAAKTRQAILDIALKLFDEKGYKNTSLSKIADELAVTRGAIYHHFANKDDILRALAEIHFRPYINRMDIALGGENSWQESAKILADTLSTLIQDPAQSQFVRLIETQRRVSEKDSPIISTVLQEYEVIFRDQLTSLIHRAIASGDIPQNTDEKLAFYSIKCTIKGVIFLSMLPESDAEITQYISPLVYNAFDNLRAGHYSKASLCQL